MKRFNFKKLAKKKLRLIIIGLGVLAALCFYFSLPGIIKNVFVSQAEKFGLKNLQFRVLHVGWQRLDLADVTLGDIADPALKIPFLSITYSPAGLWRKEIKYIRMVGAMIKIEDRGQGFRFRGMILPKERQEQTGAMITIERLSLEAGNLRFTWEQRSFEIPFSATMSAAGANYSFAARLRPLAEMVRLQGAVAKNFTEGKIEFMIPGLNMQTAIDHGGFGSSIWGKGRMAVKGEIILRGGDFKTAAVTVSSLGILELDFPDKASGVLDFFSLAFNLGADFIPHNIVASIQGRKLYFGELAMEAPFHLDIHGRQWSDLEFAVRDLQVIRPLPVIVDQITGKITGPRSAARINGDFRLQTGTRMLAALGLPLEITRPYAVAGNFQARLKSGKITWTMQAKGESNVFIGSGKESLQGHLNLNASAGGDTQRVHLTAAYRLQAAELGFEGYRARANVFSGNTELDYGFGENFRVRGMAKISGGTIVPNGGSGPEVSGISMNMPWRWPGGRTGADGHFSVTRLQSGDIRLQNISGILTQKGAALEFSGSMHTGLPQIQVSFQGNFGLNSSTGRMQTDFFISPVLLPAQTALQPLHPLLRGLTGGGRFQAEGKIWTENDQVGSSVNLKITEADFDHAGKGIALRGVNTEIKLNNLFDFVTAPAQRIAFRELKWQDKSISNGELIFAGESGGTIFMESGHFDWCRGRILLSPLRMDFKKDDFLVTFYCDRVDFAEMLNSLLGKKIASGDAEMNGIIPVRLLNGSPVFLDGYLYSTPGSNGYLKITQPEIISGGQALVEEAVRDFRYRWIKMKMSSRNNRLDLVLSIDGAPAQKLPLVYNQKQKNFIKDQSGERHVDLKGLLLEVRFSDIDLKDLLKASGEMTDRHQKK